MKKVYLLLSAVLFCALSSFAQNQTPLLPVPDEKTAQELSTQLDSLYGVKPSSRRHAAQLTTERLKVRVALNNLIADNQEKANNPAINKAFADFVGNNAQHKAAYYPILAAYLAKTAKARNMITGAVSFSDGAEFAKKYEGYSSYDYYKKGFSSTPKFHHIDHVLNVGVVNHVQLMMNINGKPALSISFISHISAGHQLIYVHSWQVIDSGEDKGLYSMNITPENSPEIQELYNSLPKAGAPIDLYGLRGHSAG